MRAKTAEDSKRASLAAQRPATVGGPVHAHVQQLCFDSNAPSGNSSGTCQQQSVSSKHQATASKCVSPSLPSQPPDDVNQASTLEVGGRLAAPKHAAVQPYAAVSTGNDSSGTSTGAPDGTDKQQSGSCPQLPLQRQQQRSYQASRQQQPPSPAPLQQQQSNQKQQQQQQQQQKQQPLPSQSCSVPTDLEVMDQLLDELVMLDPKINKALARAPPVQFETFCCRPAGTGTAALNQRTGSPTGDSSDIHRTFITACEVDDRQQQQQQQPAEQQQCSVRFSALDALLAVPAKPAAAMGQRTGLLPAPEVACSTDLFNWNLSSHGGHPTKDSTGRPRLHSLNLAPALGSSGAAGSGLGVDGDSSIASRSPRNHRLVNNLHSTAEVAEAGSHDASALFPRQPDASGLAASGQQGRAAPAIPTMTDLQYQMEHVRKLHLSGVMSVTAADLKSRQSEQQQQQQARGWAASPDQQGSASAVGVMATPEPCAAGQPTAGLAASQLQQQAWMHMPVLQPSKNVRQSPARFQTSVRLHGSLPKWKR